MAKIGRPGDVLYSSLLRLAEVICRRRREADLRALLNLGRWRHLKRKWDSSGWLHGRSRCRGAIESDGCASRGVYGAFGSADTQRIIALLGERAGLPVNGRACEIAGTARTCCG